MPLVTFFRNVFHSPSPRPSSSAPPPPYDQLLEQGATADNKRASTVEEVEKKRPKIYLYYKVYKAGGVVACKEPFDQQDPYLARIEAAHITPGHTVESIIKCICNAEGIESIRWVSSVKLFESAFNGSAMDNKKCLAPLDESGLGSDPEKPLALVVSNRLEKAVVARCSSRAHNDPQWLKYTEGDVLYTDGYTRKQETWYNGTSEEKREAFRARDESGRVGLIEPLHFSRCRGTVAASTDEKPLINDDL